MEGLDWSSQPFQCGRMCEVGLSGLLQWEEKSCLHFLSRAVQIITSFLLFVCFNSRNENSEGKKKKCLDTIEFRTFLTRQQANPALRGAVSEHFVSFKCQYTQYLWGKPWKQKPQFIWHNCQRQKCHPVMQEVPNLGSTLRMKQPPSVPTFGLRELEPISQSSQEQCLEVCLLFWMVIKKMWAVFSVDACPPCINRAMLLPCLFSTLW